MAARARFLTASAAVLVQNAELQRRAFSGMPERLRRGLCVQVHDGAPRRVLRENPVVRASIAFRQVEFGQRGLLPQLHALAHFSLTFCVADFHQVHE